MWFVYKKPKPLDVGVMDLGFLGDGSLHLVNPTLGTGVPNRRQIVTVGANYLPPVQVLGIGIDTSLIGQVTTLPLVANPMSDSMTGSNPFMSSSGQT